MRFGGLKRLAIFSFNDTATTEIYALSLHDARPIYFQGKFTTETQRARRFLLGYPRTRSPVVRALRGSSRCNTSILKQLPRTDAESPNAIKRGQPLNKPSSPLQILVLSVPLW